MSLPQRGEVWLPDLGMRAKVRPVLILNVAFGERDYALFHAIPHTTAVRNSRFEVALDIPWLKSGVFNVQGSQPLARNDLIRRLGALESGQMASIATAMRLWLGL